MAGNKKLERRDFVQALFLHTSLNPKMKKKKNISPIFHWRAAPPLCSRMQQGPCCTVFMTDILELWMNISWPDGLGSGPGCYWQWIDSNYHIYSNALICLLPVEISLWSDLRICRCFLKRKTRKLRQGEAEWLSYQKVLRHIWSNARFRHLRKQHSFC